MAAASADRDEAALLDIAPGAALLIEHCLILDQDEHPLELTDSRYVASRYSLNVTFTVESVAEKTKGK
ncbi:UTRA domain-containing protein [Nocardia salmonicida]|uniref:UTRA domain-containing protein n=1 Tax=Nocardia salmonicida TaxID=53431 RepID=UPI003CEDCBFB